MPKKRHLPESPLQGKPWPRSLEQDLAHYLVDAKKKFQTNPSHPLPAFEALNQIASYVWMKNEDPPPQFVQVPWWVVDLVACGYNLYRDSQRSSAPLSFGEAYNLEGQGKGKKPRIQGASREVQDTGIAISIAFAIIDQKMQVKAALYNQVDLTGLSYGQIRRIWEKHSKRAISAVKNYQGA